MVTYHFVSFQCLRFENRDDLELFRMSLRNVASSAGTVVTETDLRDANIPKQIITEKKGELLLAKCIMLGFTEVPYSVQSRCAKVPIVGHAGADPDRFTPVHVNRSEPARHPNQTFLGP